MSRMAVAPPPVGFRVSDSDSLVRGRDRVMGFWREIGWPAGQMKNIFLTKSPRVVRQGGKFGCFRGWCWGWRQ